MIMQRQHFEFIAATLNDQLNVYAPDSEAFYAVEDTIKWMAERLASTNPNFDRSSFLRACGMEN